ncbi:phosphonate transport system substrate-binding protein [Polaromonas sp. OV174]|uniref:PhnD/SsuA/transferrin family substrate-binding protein n=1 Tax=Polaromonas sp. OV174 TaxID=1855300 RepID=UPI0008EDB127|nr:PhnD/SsuA/transferrin family substrate-binding protein [Polaromonas sp. OV174]SFB80801.1 phosphonate transport system substrate-binding protein [Polaromonas sp. OV174]
MTINFLIAPDFAPERFAAWHMLNTALQKRSGIQLHLLTPASAAEQAAILAQGQVDVIYANPFDAAHMVRTLGYLPFARPRQCYDEMVIACAADSPLQRVEDLKPGCRIALTDNQDIKLIGQRLLEPADIGEADAQWLIVASYQAAARLAIKKEVDVAFFLADAFAAMSRMTRSQIRPLVESAIGDISHVILAHPRIAASLPALSAALLALRTDAAGHSVLDALGMTEGFEAMSQEDVEFMIDLMDTLLD